MFTAISSLGHRAAPWRQVKLSRVSLHTTTGLGQRSAGRNKITLKRDKPLTYEQFNTPDLIGVRKSWNSFSTSGLLEGIRTAEISHEDILIRKFLHGTWPKLLASDVIIKRRGNQIYCSFIALRFTKPSQMYFLIGYSEEVLSYILKSIVKLEVQTVNSTDDLVYTYI